MKTRNNGSRIFLTELMFSIMFFIIVAAICVQCFALSVSQSRDAKELTKAINVATNAAEEYLTSKSGMDFTEYYDEKWNQVTENSVEDGYKATGIITESEGSDKNMSFTLLL